VTTKLFAPEQTSESMLKVLGYDAVKQQVPSRG
jgi:hypothetical protein